MNYQEYVDHWVIEYSNSHRALEDGKILKLTPIEAIYFSSFIDFNSNIPLFVKTHACHPLDWANIFRNMSNLYPNEKSEIMYQYYLNRPFTFFNQVKEKKIAYIDSALAFKIISKEPLEIYHYFEYLDAQDIIKLPKETLNNFIDDYQAKLKEEGITFEEKAENLRECHNTQAKKDLVTYVMANGLINFHLMNLFIDFSLKYVPDANGTITHFLPLILMAIKNAKDGYLKPALLWQLLESDHKIDGTIDYNVIFLNDTELNSLRENTSVNEEIKNLQIRKYYGDLLKFLGKEITYTTKEKIIREIAKSNIKEYILFIKANYPEFLDLLLANVPDVEIYKELIDFKGTMNIDDALRVAVLERKQT